MTRDEALRCMGLLIGGTTGWTDESIEIYVERCTRLTSVGTLLRAVEQIVETWKDYRRPPLAVVLEVYMASLPRSLGLPTAESRPCDVEMGLAILWDNYEAECQRHGRQPDRSYFETWQRSLLRQST